MTPVPQPVAIVTGGSAGLGRVIAAQFLAAGYRVAIVGRNKERLGTVQQELLSSAPQSTTQSVAAELVMTVAADVTDDQGAQLMADVVGQRGGRIDVLVNCVGTSDRGLTEQLTATQLELLFRQNVTTALLCSQACLPKLRESRGAIVNIGSLAAKVGARYLGGYPAAKHALAGLTQQMRLELQDQHVHVGLVCPGPIRRDDAGIRYASSLNEETPPQANQPGGGTRVKGLSPERVAAAVLKCVQRRCPEIILPGYLRILIAIGNAAPRLGDWLLLKFTSSRPDSNGRKSPQTIPPETRT